VTNAVEPKTPAERDAVLRGQNAQREHERKVVAEHYQERAEIFSKVLDRRLAYATGFFERDDEDLETAQARKYALVERWLSIQPGEKVLDVGCGWGSNMLYLAEHTQGRFHGVTLSDKQAEEARRRAQDGGVGGKVRIDVCHVEDLDLAAESYDCVIFSGSIVHMHNRAEVHEMVGRILRPGGRLLISDCYFPAAERGDRASSATHYIFVTALGYCRLLQLSEELALVERAGLDVARVEDMTHSYVLTLRRWIDNVRKNRGEIDTMSPGFADLLQTYMTVAKMSFMRRSALEYMVLAKKPGGRAG
jgi:cyclopropane-fatty-acyl-phospholipid synthase